MSFLDLTGANIQHRSANLFLQLPVSNVTYINYTSETYPLVLLDTVNASGDLTKILGQSNIDNAYITANVLALTFYTQVIDTTTNRPPEQVSVTANVNSLVFYTQVFDVTSFRPPDQVSITANVNSLDLEIVLVATRYLPIDQLNISANVNSLTLV